MAGNSFIVTVSAPKAPCTHTHTSVSVGSHGDGARAAPAARCKRQLSTVMTRMSSPTPLAR